jgi:hypothetical protein
MCSQLFTSSLSLPKYLKPLLSGKSSLFLQNAGVGYTRDKAPFAISNLQALLAR